MGSCASAHEGKKPFRPKHNFRSARPEDGVVLGGEAEEESGRRKESVDVVEARVRERLANQCTEVTNDFFNVEEDPSKRKRFSVVLYPGYVLKKRKIPQDSYAVAEIDWYGVKSKAVPMSKHYLFCVFDGHGDRGHMVADFTAEIFPDVFTEAIQKTKNFQKAFNRSFKETEKKLEATSINMLTSGTTATVVCLSSTQAHVANVGDSRCILASRDENGNRVVRDLTKDHNCQSKTEKERIKKSGGDVRQAMFGDNYAGPDRVFLPHSDVPGLAVTRSFGDELAHQVGVTGVPEYLCVDLRDEDDFIILASDGVWDQMSSLEAAQYIDFQKASDDACEKLLLECARRWVTKSAGLSDDISATVIYLTNQSAAVQKEEKTANPVNLKDIQINH